VQNAKRDLKRETSRERQAMKAIAMKDRQRLKKTEKQQVPRKYLG
jgi:hypothetical protein